MIYLKRLYGIKENKLILYAVIYAAIVYLVSFIFNLSLIKIIVLILFPSWLVFVLLDTSWHLLLTMALVGFTYYFFDSSRIVHLHTIFLPFVILLIASKPIKFSRISLKSLTHPMYILVAIIVITSIFSYNVKSSLIYTYIISQYFIFYFFLKNIILTKKKLLVFYFIILISSTPIVMLGLFEFIINNSLRNSSILASPNEFGAFVAMYIFLLLPLYYLNGKKGYKLIILVLLLLSMIVMLSTQSRAAQLSILVSLIFYFLLKGENLKSKAKFLFVFGLIAVGYAVFFGVQYIIRFENIQVEKFGISEFDRIGMWIAAVKIFLKSPMVGVGGGNYTLLYPKYHPFFNILGLTRLRVAHNIFFNTAAEMGVLGLIALLHSHIFIYKKIKISVNRGSNLQKQIYLALFSFFIYIIIHNMFDCIWTDIGHQVSLWILTIFLFLTFNTSRILNESK